MGETAQGKTMKRIVKIQNVGNVAFPDDMSDDAVNEAAGKLHAQANQKSKPAKSKQWEPGEDDPIARIEASDGKRYDIHLDDLAKMKELDPKLKVHA